MKLRLLALITALSLPVAAQADGSGVIRLLNATGHVLKQVTITPCGGGQPVATLNRGEQVDPYDTRFWSVPPGCYIVRGNGTERRLIVGAGIQFDAALI